MDETHKLQRFRRSEVDVQFEEFSDSNAFVGFGDALCQSNWI
jgi:hypothetical protein